MNDRTLRGLGLMLLATSSLTAFPALAQDNSAEPQTTGQSTAPATNATDVTGETPAEQVANDGNEPDPSEIVITATKREENLQNVPISVTVLGSRKLDQLNITNFEQYTKQLPSVSFQTAQPGYTVVYMRGVATGGDGNHSGSLPSVGTYLDEQPVTTIGGTLDVHIYDIARIESLAGPQGTLYGASSQAGTIRIITNKPELGVTTGRIDGELNKVSHGGVGGNLEGMFNMPLGANIALRAVAFYQKDAGYIDNIFGSRSYAYPGGSIDFDNSNVTKRNFNTNEVYGGRVALKVDLDDNWTILPQFMYQKQNTEGVFFRDKAQGDLETVRFMKEPARDRFWQAALTVQGKIANFDVTYAGAYMDRPRYGVSDYTDYTDAYNQYYIDYYNTYVDTYGVAPSFCSGPGILGCQVYRDNAGNIINPRQYIVGTDHFKKMSHELRVASPADKPVRAIVGAFLQRQTNHIKQDYKIDDLADNLSVGGYPGTIWLTNQQRKDKDSALFGEVSWDVVQTVTLTAGGRLYKFDNTLFGFAGFGAGNPGGYSSGENRCLTINGLQARNDPGVPLAQGNSGLDIPCYNVADVDSSGRAVPRRSKGDGHIYRFNAQWKPQQGLMVYGTMSKGFRPGGINRQPDAPGYQPDFLTNYEFGWKTTFMGNRIRWNGAIYHQKWEGLQFSYLGPNSLTVIQNGRNANINGIESDVNYTNGGLSFSANAAYTNAKTSGNICNAAIVIDPSKDCTGIIDVNDPADPTDDDIDSIVVPSGTRLPVTPKFKGSVVARYSWPMWTGKAHVQGVVAHQSSAPSNIRVADAALLGKIDASTLVDMFVGYDWGRYNVELFGSNVFDERNQLSRSVGCGLCDQVRIVPGRPRTFGLRGGVKF
ncbi:MAG: TonB-dependent receptor [Sphingomicrobium sp.]